MVRGVEKFGEFFRGYESAYVIIGGTACEIQERINLQITRTTKDLDIILVVEALTSEFVSRFWEFIKMGGYAQRYKGTSLIMSREQEYYRFVTPSNTAFPLQIELFSRNLGLIAFPEDARVTPIPIDDELSSLSAILMDDDYYYFTIRHSDTMDGVHIAKIESLICLKCKAFIEMVSRKSKGDQVDNRHIEKHKKDVFRLATLLAPANKYEVPKTIKGDVANFCKIVFKELPNQDFFKSLHLKNITGEKVLAQIETSFLLND